MVSTLPQVLKLAASPLHATWPLGPPAKYQAAAGKVTHGTSTCSGAKSPVGGTSPRLPLCPPLLNLPSLAPPWASTPPTPALHPGLEMTRCAHPPGVCR